MWRTTLRSLLSHKLRLALSALSIVLGVAFVSGTLIFTDTLSKTFTSLFQATSADVTVLPKAAFEVGFAGPEHQSARATLSDDVVQQVRAVDGVAAAQGYVQSDGVYILQRDGKVMSTGGAPGIGMSWSADSRLSPATLVGGRAPRGPDEVAIDTGSRTKTGFAVGDRITLLTTGPRKQATLVGVFRFGTSGGLAGASLVAFDAATAQSLLAAPGRWDGVDALAAPGRTQEQVRDAVAARIGPTYDVKTKKQQADALSTEFSKGLQFFNVFLLVFAGIALFVGSFIILNTFSMLVAQRTRELALLRALGASRRQIVRSVLAEAAALGVLGSTIGLLGGFGLASGLRALFGSFGLTLDGALVLSPRTVLWAYAVGVIVTLLAAYLPARRASRTAPVAAMRDDLVVQERSLARRTAIGGALTAVGVALLVAGVRSSGTLVGIGALALVVGAIALSPVLARPFVRVAGGLLPRLWGTTGRLAQENALRNPRRTAATASALMVGLSLVTAFSVIGSSTNASVDKLVADKLGADFVVSTAVQQPFTPAVGDALQQVPGVAGIVRQRLGVAQVDGKRATLTALGGDVTGKAIRLDFRDGSFADLTDSTMLVSDATGYPVGGTAALLLPNGQRRDLRVGARFAKTPVVSNYVVTTRAYEQAGGPALDQFVFVSVAPGADVGRVRGQLQRVAADYPVVTLKDQTQFKDEQKAQVKQLLLLINALLVLSVVIAVLGIVNTLALSVIERTREIGLLRAVGMGRRQLRRMVRLESVVLSLYGAALGLALGLVFGIALARSLRNQGIAVLHVPVGQLAVFLVLAAVVGVLAAVAPARRAARLRLLDAIATT